MPEKFRVVDGKRVDSKGRPLLKNKNSRGFNRKLNIDDKERRKKNKKRGRRKRSGDSGFLI